jgi:hypothetical protein
MKGMSSGKGVTFPSKITGGGGTSAPRPVKGARKMSGKR